MKLPRCDRSICLHAALDVDHTSRTEVCPGELFSSCPDKFHWFVCGTGEPRSFNSTFTAVFASVARASVRNNHAHLVFTNMKRFSQFASNSKRSLSSSPNGKLVGIPFRHRSAWFQWCMCDVGYGVCLR